MRNNNRQFRELNKLLELHEQKYGNNNGFIGYARDINDKLKLAENMRSQADSIENEAADLAAQCGKIIKARVSTNILIVEGGIFSSSQWLQSNERAQLAIRYPAGDYTGADIAERVLIDPHAVKIIRKIILTANVKELYILGVHDINLEFAFKQIFTLEAAAELAVKTSSIARVEPFVEVITERNEYVKVLAIAAAGIGAAHNDLVRDLDNFLEDVYYIMHVSFELRLPETHEIYTKFCAAL